MLVNCPDDVVLRAFLLGDLAEPSLEEVADHLEECARCEERANRLDGLADAVLGAIQEPSRRASSAPKQSDSVRPGPRGYEILGFLGRGGMATVFKALQVELNRVVALKMILGGAHAGAEELARFRNEASAAARLQHPNLVQTYEIGQQDGELFLALEYVEGGSLDEYLGGKPQPPRSSAEVVESLARAIHYAHRKGVVHRDLKPANILLAAPAGHSNGSPEPPKWEPGALPPSFVPKITDFGLAKHLGPELDQTHTGTVMGTPTYMAPEQAVGDRHLFGPTIDVYSLGAILYQMLTGHVPFKGATVVETLSLVRFQEPVPPRQLQPGLPRDLQTICLKCLEKEPRKRYPSALALAEDLRRFLDHEPIQARPAGFVERVWKRARRQPVIASLVSMLIVGFVIGVAGIVGQWRTAVREHQRAETQRERALAARDLAETNLYFSRIAQIRLEWLLNHNTQAARELLDQCVPRAGQADHRGWEWRHLEALLHAELLTVSTPQRVSGVAISPDGRVLATGGGDSQVPKQSSDPSASIELRLWDASTGEHLARLQGHTRLVTGVAFSPSGKLLASVGLDRTIRIWDAAAAQLIRTLNSTSNLSRSVTFSPDGRLLLSGGADRTVTLWDWSEGKPLATLNGHRFPVQCVAFSPDGQRFASGCIDGENGEVIVWDVASRSPLRRFNNVPGQVSSLAFSPDGNLLAVAAGRAVVLQDVVSGRIGHTLIGHSGSIKGVAFRPDGEQVATAGTDRTARLWNVRTGEEAMIFRGHSERLTSVAYHPTGRSLVSADESGAVKIWDVTAPPDCTQVDSQDRFPFQAQALAFESGGQRVRVIQSDGIFKEIDAVTGVVSREQPLDLTPRWLTPATLAVFSGDGRLAATVSGDDARVVKLWKVSEGMAGRVLSGPDTPAEQRHTDAIVRLAFSHNGRRLATATAGFGPKQSREVKVWDTDSGRPCFSALATSVPLLDRMWGCLALSPDGNRVVFDGMEGSCGGGKADGSLISGFSVINVHDVDRGKVHSSARQRVLCAGTSILTSLAFSPDGRYLAAGDEEQSILLWDLGEEGVASARMSRALVHQLEFSPDGRRLAGVSREQVHIWEVPTGQEVFVLRGTPPPRSSLGFNPQVAWSPDGRRLAAGNWKRSVNIWDTEDRDTAALRLARCEAAQTRAFGWHLRQASSALALNATHAFEFHWRAVRGAEPPDLPSTRWRGLLLACQGDWSAAASDYRRALVGPSVDGRTLSHAACLQWLAEDTTGCAETCRLLARRTRNERFVKDVIRTLALVGEKATDPGGIEELARARTARIEDWIDWHILGLANYRAGHYDDAVRHCRRSLELNPSADARSVNYLVLALAESRLGHCDEALRWRTQADEWARGMTRGESDRARLLLKLDPLDGMAFLILQKEAKRL